ncbi:hypothetical protein AGP67_23285 [Salmonella enterica subsp. enterica serovar Derby]|uniref:Uncharacterized protein n=1 Tax=Salmonella derby TaxID=28144 RepID=A0A600XD67_SALDE|nr:hypothetical protein [Salmonella enterica]EAY2657664.1 hypothetical protein [Salmonella enterica subsp. enterica serovar Typhimurium]EEG5696418.1 hypothetical protein [Salmonella enterica subsp. enterica]QUZ51822.1 hypothetical protein JYM77_08165 [Salmonella enterica subsp. enterica serovar Derby str. CFSAN000565]ASO43750.1 hypothetical protein CHD02_17990 [Salmonella enterica subsp. enterica serovar Derby]EAO5562750.1 hypothetical protein [Salmonella enterica]
MENEESIAWVTKAFHLSDNNEIAEALTTHLDWLLWLEPDYNEDENLSFLSCLPPFAALGIFLGTAAMIRCGEAFRAQYWLEEAVESYHWVCPNGSGSWRGNTPLHAAKKRYPALNIVLFDAACANGEWQRASAILESLGAASDEVGEYPCVGFTRTALKNVVAEEHSLGPFYYDEAWLLEQQERLINANVLNEYCEDTWRQYKRHLHHLINVGRTDDALLFAREKIKKLNHIEDRFEFYLTTIGLYSSLGLLDEALSVLMELIRRNTHLYYFICADGDGIQLTPELKAWMKNLLKSPQFRALKEQYLTRNAEEKGRDVNANAFRSISEKILGGKTRKRCAVSRKLISPGEPIYRYRMMDGIEYIAGKAAFEASDLYIQAQQQATAASRWRQFAERRPGRGVFDHPDIARFVFERIEGKSFDAVGFIRLIANSLVFPMRFKWVAGLDFTEHHAADDFFVNDDLAGEFVNACWVAMQCGHARDIFNQLAQEPQNIADPIYAMLATFDRPECRAAAAAHFALPELPEVMARAFSSRISLDNLLKLADFGRDHLRFAQALAVALSRYNLHLYSNYRPQVDWYLQGLEQYGKGKGGQLLYFFIHIPQYVPVLSAMLERGVIPYGIGEGAYDAYNNSVNYFHHAAAMHCMLHSPDKLAHWMETSWIETLLTGAPFRETKRHVAAYQKMLSKQKR